MEPACEQPLASESEGPATRPSWLPAADVSSDRASRGRAVPSKPTVVAWLCRITGRLRGARSEQGGQQIVVRKLAQPRSLETGHGFLP
jgi:hypothetical protein